MIKITTVLLLVFSAVTHAGPPIPVVVDGWGTLTYPDGSKYIGQFKDNKFNGWGTLTLEDGSKYIGQIRANSFNGWGEYAWKDHANKPKYIGKWKDGSRHGYGIDTRLVWKWDAFGNKIHLPDKIRKGQWENGTYLGE